MRRFFQHLAELYQEQRRRSVHRVAGVYAVTLFVLLQIAEVTFGPLGISEIWIAVMVVGGVAAFPVVVVLAWIFDITEEGVKQTSPGPLADTLGRTTLRRAATVFGTAAASTALGLGAWQWAAPSNLPEPPSVPAEISLDLDPRRIGVLYLDDHSPDGDLDWLAAELTEGLINELTSVEGLDVPSRNAMKPYRYAAVPMDSIVRALGLGSVVEGSVARSGDRIRVTVQLFDGATLSHLDSKEVEGTLDDPFAFQDSLYSFVARELRRRLGREIRTRSARAGTGDAAAWTAYARGREQLEHFTILREGDAEAAHQALMRADSLFIQAGARDPAWDAPVLQRAVVWGSLASLHGPLPGALDPTYSAGAESFLEEVLERNPEHVRALAFRGWLWTRLARTPGISDPSGLSDRAEADLRRALALDPDLASAWWTLSELLVSRTRFAEAVVAAERALAADAFLEEEEGGLFSLFTALAELAPDEDAIRFCEQGRRRYPQNANFITCRFIVLASFPQVDPDPDLAWALRDSLVMASSAGSRDAWRDYGTVWVARVLARAGMPDSARAVVAQVHEPGETPPWLSYDEAHLQVLLGDKAEAVRLLSVSLSHDPDTSYAREDWWFQELRDYEPFQQLVGLPPSDGASGR